MAIDLFCGLGGWTDGLLAEGYEVVGFDIERHEYGNERYPAQLVVQDVLTLHGSQFKDANLIVASPPCQEYSYMAMPWGRAKQIARALRGKDEFPEGYTGSRTLADLNRLFKACFRIQKEASEATGRDIPLVVENVRGAQPWVGRARWNFGSFYLWGDVPALMPVIAAKPMKNTGGSWFMPLEGRDYRQKNCPDGRASGDAPWKNPGLRFDGSGRSFQTESVNNAGVKQHGSGREWFAGEGKISRMTGSKSPARKAASAMIAKIPFDLSRHIAATFKPQRAAA